MSSLEAKTQEASVFFTLDGFEHGLQVSSGADRWDVVARAVGARRGCAARAEEPPAYDTGTRSWTLCVTLLGRRGRGGTVQVPVRW